MPKDSEKLRGILNQIGYEEAEEDEADFVIYNTCTVRENANTRVYGRLGQLKPRKKQQPHMMIGLCGCMMQEPEVIAKLKKSYSFVDIIFGTHNIYKFAELICERYEAGKMVVDIWEDTDKIVEELPNEENMYSNPELILCSAVIISAAIVLFHMCVDGKEAESRKQSSGKSNALSRMECLR